MTRAYSELYLDDAMRNLGEAMEYTVRGCGMDPDRFMTLFNRGFLISVPYRFIEAVPAMHPWTPSDRTSSYAASYPCCPSVCLSS